MSAKLIVIVDAHLYRDKNGKVWAERGVYAYGLWKRYLKVFREITVLSRMEDIDSAFSNMIESSGPGVTFKGLPMIHGTKEPLKYIFRLFDICHQAKEAFVESDCAIFRIPAIISYLVLGIYDKLHKPYALEVVVDQKHAEMNPLLKLELVRRLKKACLRANGVAYVTKYALQQQYPSYARLHGENSKHFESYYSDVILEDSYFTEPRDYSNHCPRYKLVHTGFFDSHVKGQNTAIRVVKELREKGYDVVMTFVGDGIKKKEYEELVRKYGLENEIQFTGMIAVPMEIRRILIESDIYLFPSKVEGLPRSVLEAMAVGLPCLSTPVDGIPELLCQECLFMPDDVKGFVDKIAYLIEYPTELTKISEQNINKATEYREDILELRRTEYYSKLKELAESKNRRDR